MSIQFIPNGDTFIANVALNSPTFTANVIANSPTAYLRIVNGGDLSGNTKVGIWVAATSQTTPINIDFSAPNDPGKWAAKINGTYLKQDEDAIIAINNTLNSKQATNLQFAANVDVASTGTYSILLVQPVLPL